MRLKRLINLLVVLLLVVGATTLRPVAGCAVASADQCCDHCNVPGLNRAACDAACQVPVWIGGFVSSLTFEQHRVSYVGGSSELAGLDIAPDLPPPRGQV